MGTPVIVHLDLDCFFAAVEQSRRPNLSGKPVVVGADPKGGFGRGVVATANYEARKFGIQSAMPISHAYRLCPHAAFLPGDYREYARVSRRVMETAQLFFPEMQRTGIDEAFFQGGERFEEAVQKAEQVRTQIRQKEKITASIGIAWNKPIAKIATDLNKPNGLTVIRPDELQTRIWPLAAAKLWGVGKKTESRLLKLGIRTIGDLALAKTGLLSEALGAWGFALQASANGFGSATLSHEWAPKSCSRENTFSEDVSDAEVLEKALLDVARRAHKDVEQEGVCFRTITVKIRFEDFETHTRSRTVRATQSLETAIQTARKLARPAWGAQKRVRLLGVRLSGFSHGAGQKKLENFR